VAAVASSPNLDLELGARGRLLPPSFADAGRATGAAEVSATTAAGICGGGATGEGAASVIGGSKASR